jgi:hypothetical protein
MIKKVECNRTGVKIAAMKNYFFLDKGKEAIERCIKLPLYFLG